MVKTELTPELEMAQWFKLLRKEGMHLTQAQLAEKTGIPLGTIRHFERTGRIGFPAFMKLAVTFDVAHQFLSLARNEEPETFFKIQKEKTISRLMDDLEVATGKATAMEVTRRNTALPIPKIKQWRRVTEDKWHLVGSSTQ